MKYVIGDIHGAQKALVQCLSRSGFNYSKDTLIVLGDVCDGWHETPQCIEELLKITNLIFIIGNHDFWLNKWFKEGWSHPSWELQGGQATKDAYIKNGDLLVKHRDFFDKALYHYKDGNNFFVHGGINLNHKIVDQDVNDLMWDRKLFITVKKKHSSKPYYKYFGFDSIFIGHTQTRYDYPKKYCNVFNLDQGAGWNGKLTLMEIDSKKYFQSDNVLDLYPNIRGRY